MEEDDLLWVLGAFPQPVFLTDGETVQWRNAAASAVLDPGASLQPMLQGTAFGLWSRRGTLRLSLPFGGSLCDFSVRAMQRGLLFLADAPHEPSAAAGAALKASAILRRPLQNVMTAARELFDRVEDLEESAATAVSSELNRGLYQLLRLCGQLTTGGELLAGTCKPERRRVDLTALLDGIADDVAPLFERAGRRFVYRGLPAAVTADADDRLVERAVYNLLSNALAFTPAGGEICLSLERREQSLLIRVTDTGEGFPESVLGTLFDRYSLIPVGDPRWGTGYGLPMVREIARLHGGTLMAANVPTGGADVMFTLSLVRRPAAVRTAQQRFDYLSGYRHALVELSDSLSASLYDPATVS